MGLDFHPERIKRTPNTIDAHRLIWFAGQKGVQDAAMEAVFLAYFIEAQDIGQVPVLADCGALAGLDREIPQPGQRLRSDGAGDARGRRDRPGR